MIVKSPDGTEQGEAIGGPVAIETRLHEIAIDASRLDDFGNDDYLAGLRVMVRALEQDIGLKGEDLVVGARPVIKGLIGRLYSQKGWTDEPSILQTPVPNPLFITGIPRTGTTALHHLLGLDPQFQGLESWLIPNPMIRPPRSEWEGMDLFRTATAAASSATSEKRSTHWIDPRDYNECQGLMLQTMVTNSFGSQRTVPSYDSWFRVQDQTPGFLRLADQLRLIGAASDKPWLLKNPSHLLSIDALFAAFPDANVVVLHRDPVAAIPSLCNLLWIMRRERPGAPDSDPRLIGHRELTVWRRALGSYDKLKHLYAPRLMDIYQRDLIDDPINVANLIYERFGIERAASTERLMRRRLVSTRMADRGAAKYRAEDFGLSEELIRTHYAHYRDTYGFAA